MKFQVFALAWVAAVSIPVFAGETPESEYFAQYPQTESRELKSGAEVKLPMYFYDNQLVMLNGTADLEAVSSLLATVDLHPVLAPEEGRAMANIVLADNKRTSLGPYKEMIIAIPAATAPKHVLMPSMMQGMASLLSIYMGGPSEKYGIFVWKVLVTTQLALDAGLEVWGVPKSLADIQFNVPADGSRGEISAKDPANGKAFFSAKWNAPVASKFPFRSFDYYSYTPADIFAARERCLGEGVAYSRKFDAEAGDQVRTSAAHPWSAALEAVEFQPTMLISTPKQRTVFFGPEGH